MTNKINCWEFKKCGREKGGINVQEFGICPASIQEKTNGVNCGKNGGRCCWALAGTMCGNIVQGSFASKLANCMNCEFYKAVQKEECGNVKTTSEILDMI